MLGCASKDESCHEPHESVLRSNAELTYKGIYKSAGGVGAIQRSLGRCGARYAAGRNLDLFPR